MTNAELAVLGLIIRQPCHGYQVEQVIEERGMRRWTEIGFSSIYFLLKKLERQKFIKGEWEKTDSCSERWIKVYRPTKAGREAFHSGIVELLSVPQASPYPLMLGLANLPAVSTDEAITSLNQYKDNLAAITQSLKNISKEKHHTHPYFVEAIFEHSITMIEVESAWLEGFIKKLKTKSKENRSE